jgi:serine O-acetyltransferase
MFDCLRQDFCRCGDTTSQRVKEMLFNIGMWAVVSYRLRRWIFQLRLPRPLKLPLNLISALTQLVTEVLTGIQIPCSADIGPGLYIPHTGYIVISSGAVIGSNCTLTQGVTIGHGGGGRRSAQGCPQIGDRVYIGPGAAITGPISVGDDALIGVGAIVIRSVPACAVVVGNPGRIISSKGSFDLITYPGMEHDAARVAAFLATQEMQEQAEYLATTPDHNVPKVLEPQL